MHCNSKKEVSDAGELVIRIGCYNVHNFTNAQWKDTTQEISDVITDFDICGLQEVDNACELERLNRNFKTLHDNSHMGNALVFSQKKEIPNSAILWYKFYDFKLPYYKRGVLSVQFGYLGRLFHIYSTHLDHQDEQIRLYQIEKLKEIIEHEKQQLYDGREFTHLLLGDFNSLTRSDYTEEVWNEITEIRKKNDWEPPQTDVMDTLKDMGYVDLIGEYCKSKGQEVPLTSRFDTRVDYILSNESLRVKHAGVINSYASDHLPVYIDLVL